MRSRKSMLMVLTVLFVFVTTLIPMSAFAAVTLDEAFFDVTPTADGVWTNAVTDGMSFGYGSWGSHVNPNEATQTLVTDPLTGASVMRVQIPKGDVGNYILGAGNNLFGSDAASLTETFENRVTWFEYDLYYNGAVTQTSFTGNASYGLMTIKDDGSVSVGHKDWTQGPAGTIQPNVWYHIVVAVDPIDNIAGTEARFYAWINGTKLIDRTDGYCRSIANETTAMWQFFVNPQRRTTTDVDMYIGGVKFYTSSNSVEASGFDPAAYIENAAITSESVKIDGPQIKVVAGTTIADLDALIEDTLYVTYWDGETQLDADSTEAAIGKTVKTSDGVAIKSYTVVEDTGITDYVNMATNGTFVNTLTGTAFTADGRLTPSASTNPYTGAAETKVSISSGGSGWPSATIDIPGFTTAGKTVWYEYDIRIGDTVPDFRLKGLGYSNYTVLVEGNGSVQLAHFGAGYVAPEGTIKPNGMYKFVIAVDYIKTNYPVFTLWINGEKIASNGSPSWTVGATNMGLEFFPAAKNASFSCAKVYTTDYSVDEAISSGKYDPTAYSKAAEIKSDALTIDGDKILTMPGTTLADIASKIDAGLTVTYFDANGAVINDMTTAAIGTTVLTGKDGSFKHYNVVDGSFIVVENYLDMGINAAGTAQTNAAVANRTFNNALGSGTNFAYVDDATKGHKVVKLYNSVVWRSDAFAADATDGVMWYDMSFKFEGGIPTMDMRATGGVFGIENGRLWLSSIAQTNASYGTGIEIPVDLVTDKWYNFKIAVDYVDKYEQVTIVEGEEVKTYLPKWYLWIDGEFMDRSGKGFTLAKGTGAMATSNRVDFYTTIAEGNAVYLDALKMYKTSTPVRMANGELCFDPTEGFDMTVAGTTYRLDAAFMRNGGAYQPNAYITNATNEDKNCVVTFAWYDENGLIDFVVANDEPITIKAGSKAAVVVNGNVPNGATYGRVFVWDSFETLKPAFASTDVTFN